MGGGMRAVAVLDSEQVDPVLPADLSYSDDLIGQLHARNDHSANARLFALGVLSHIQNFALSARSPYSSFQRSLLERAAFNLRLCGEYLLYSHFYDLELVKLTAASFCRQSLLCPLCSYRRSVKYISAYLKRYLLIRERHPDYLASLLTITVKDGSNLAERFNHLRRLFSHLLMLRRSSKVKNICTEWQYIEGGVGSFEIKRGAGSGLWHVHLHLVIFHSRRLNVDLMRDEIRRITGDSHVFRIDPFRRPDLPISDFCEVLKYSVAFSEFNYSDLIDSYLTLRRRRLIVSFGAFYGVQVLDDDDAAPLSDVPYFQYFYNYIGRAYSLVKISAVSPR